MLRSLLIVALTAALTAASACGGDSGATPKDATPGDQTQGVDHGVTPDLGRDTAPKLDGLAQDGSDAKAGDAKVSDAKVSDAKVTSWPPAGPYHTGKKCSLPACNPSGAATTDLSGKWTTTVTTNSQTCNPLARAMDPRLQPGHVETVKGQIMPRAGECVYKDKVGGTLVGVIKGNIMITCEVMAAVSGVTPVVESQITFSGTGGTGPAWTYLFDVPLPPVNCKANCTAKLTKE